MEMTKKKKKNDIQAGEVFAHKISGKPRSFNKEERTFEVIWTTGRRVDRGNYAMELDLSEQAVDLSRLKNGAPVLDNHDSSGGMCGPAQGLHGRSQGQIGVVEDAWFEGEGNKRLGIAKLRLSSRESVKPILEDIENGVIRNVSVGFSIQEYEEVDRIQNENRDIPVYMARQWQPMEISPVQAGADDAAIVRSLPEMLHNSLNTKDPEHYKSVIEQAVDKMGEKVAEIITERKVDEPISDVDTNTIETTSEITNKTKDEELAMNEEEKKALVEAERKRALDITEAVKKAGLERSFADEMISSEVSIEDARKMVIDKMAEKSEAQNKTRSNVVVGDNLTTDHVRSGLQNSWLSRGSTNHKLDEHGKDYAGLSLVRSASVFLERVHNVRTGLMSNDNIIKRALSTSDFPELLADTMNKSLRGSYTGHDVTFEGFTRRVQVADFKEISRKNFGDAPALEKVQEHGSVKLGSMSEASEKYSVETYAKKLRLTRKMLINDDLDAFIRIPEKFGIAARDLESDVVWAIITANSGLGVNMGDGNPIHHASNSNIGTGGALSDTTIGEMEKLLLLQTGLDGRQIQVPAKTIYAPVAMRTQLRKYLTQITPNSNSEIKLFTDLSGVTEARLDAQSATRFYLFSSASDIDMVELATLSGEGGPSVETKNMGGLEGIEVQAAHDVGAAPIDYRGFTTNAGA